MKKLLALCLILSILLSCLPVWGAWENEEDIARLLAELEIMQGDTDGNLRLDDTITRAEFAKVVIASSEFKDSVATGSRVSPFQDVPASHWAAPYVQLAVNKGFCKGYLDATFRPDNTILFEEGITMLLQVLGYTKEDFGNSWPYGQVGIAKRIGLCDNLNLDIGDPLTRRDVMRLCYHLLTATPKNGNTDYITTLHYNIVEDVVLIATAYEDSSVGGDKIVTSNGTYRISDSFRYDHVGKKGDAVIKDQDRLVAFVPDSQTVEQYIVYQVLGDDIVVTGQSGLTTLNLDTGLSVYHKSQKVSLNSLLSSLEAGDLLTTYQNSLGILDYGVVYTGQLEGPFTYTGQSLLESWRLTNPTVTRNGAVIETGQLSQYDIVYYSKGLNQIWAYNNKVTGIYESASPNQDMPTQITVSGKTYSIEGANGLKKLATGGSYSYGDSVTLLLGKDGGVADVVSPSQMDTTVYGYLTASGTKNFTVAGTGESYTDHYVSVVLTTGETYEYAAAKEYKTLINAPVKVTFSNGKATVSRLKSSNVVGQVDWNGRTLGNSKLSSDLMILEISTTDPNKTGVCKTVFPQRLDGVTLDNGEVLHAQKNSKGEIEQLILLDTTGDLYDYGMIKSARTNSSMGAGVGGTYVCVIDGAEMTVSGQVEYSVRAGVPAKILRSGNQVITMRSLEAVPGTADQVTLTEFQVGSKTYPLSDTVWVYRKNYNNNYTSIPLTDAINGDYSLTGYYDKPISEGGQIRIIIAQ